MQIKGTDIPHPPPPLQTGVPVLRTGVGTRSLAAAAVGGAGGGGPYASHNRPHHHSVSNLRNAGAGGMANTRGYLSTQYYPHTAAPAAAGGGGGFGSEGAALSAAALAAASSIGGSRNSWSQQLDQLRTDDLMPTPLEISSPGGAGDILSLSCLGSYLAVRTLLLPCRTCRLRAVAPRVALCTFVSVWLLSALLTFSLSVFFFLKR